MSEVINWQSGSCINVSIDHSLMNTLFVLVKEKGFRKWISQINVVTSICSQWIHELLFGKWDGPKYFLSEPSALTMWWDLPSQNPSWVKPEYAEAFFLLLFPLLRSPLKQPSLQVSNFFPLFHFFSSFNFLLFLLSSAKYSSCSLGFNLLKYLGCYFWLGGVNTLSVLPALKGKMILECWGHGKTRTKTWNHVIWNSFGTWGF